MSIQVLLAVLHPPQAPIEVPNVRCWGETERLLGQLPEDYREFLECFGSGCLNDFIWVFNPASRNRHLQLVARNERILSALRELRAGGEECPYPLWPEPRGLLSFGVTDNGDYLFWLTTGEPRHWPVVVNAGREPTYEEFSCDMTDFLAGIVTGRLRSSILPEDLSAGPHGFLPRN